MRQSVRARFLEFQERFEGRIPHMYLDIKGLVTTGIGNLVDPVEAAIRVPWVSQSSGGRADETAVRAEWTVIKGRQDLAKVGAKSFAALTDLRLTDEGMGKIVIERAESNETHLRRVAEFAAYDDWPADAQLGLMSLAWAMGAGFADQGRWPSFRKAVAAADWAAAAAQSAMGTAGNPGLVPRNQADRQLFLNAQRVVNEGLDPDRLLFFDGAGGSTGGTRPQSPSGTGTGRAVFLSGGNAIGYDVGSDQASGTAFALSDHWTGVAGTGFEDGVRAVVDLGGSRYAFKDGEYVRIHDGAIDAGYPRSIVENWPGFDSAGFGDGPDAAVAWDDATVYFFKGDQYLRYDVTRDTVDEGYPRPIAGNWPGLAEAGVGEDVDAAVAWPNGKVYFFRGGEYLRYDKSTDRADVGYPQSIASGWPGLADAGLADDLSAVWLE